MIMFFFKQKTAYEVRISDWSSDVCSSDLLDVLKFSSQDASRRLEKLLLSAISNWQAKNEGVRIEDSNLYVKLIHVDSRSEEHTSELQSLMRISYAVFCLKKQKTK